MFQQVKKHVTTGGIRLCETGDAGGREFSANYKKGPEQSGLFSLEWHISHTYILLYPALLLCLGWKLLKKIRLTKNSVWL
jgi:hypothetical protein